MLFFLFLECLLALLHPCRSLLVERLLLLVPEWYGSESELPQFIDRRHDVLEDAALHLEAALACLDPVMAVFLLGAVGLDA